MIAMALVNDPQLLIADEPTTALDVTVQAQILDLLQDLQREFDSALMMITHDLGVVAEIADDVMVMYAGRASSTAPPSEILTHPSALHLGPAGSIPEVSRRRRARLIPIPGNPPSLLNPPSGCSFHPRCPHDDKVPGDLCRTTLPDLLPGDRGENHVKRCHLANPGEIYTEVLPEIAPDLIDPTTGERSRSWQQSTPTRFEGRMSIVTNSDVERAPENPGASVGNETLLEVRDLKKYFPVKSGGVIRRTVATSRQSTESRSRCARVARWAWSVSPDAARRRPAA